MDKIEQIKSITNYKYLNYIDDMKKELIAGFMCQDAMKDILIVVKDQYEYIQNCIDSICSNTNNFNLYLWDNGSNLETARYLECVAQKNNCFLVRSEINEGFIKPNNELIKLTTSPYIILLNSDTEVKANWDLTMLGLLQQNSNLAAVGYGGCSLDKNFDGGRVAFGSKIDYIAGWSICIKRDIYDKFGLFDEVNLEFAYCEDADFCLRLKEAGLEIYAINVELVNHYENKTIKSVQTEEFKCFFKECLEKNREYCIKRWKDFL